ncbi:hypothetical protein WJX74_003068 [Apatococcus lobatus]|uniref:Uncharacterized protein n=1 Tax=Apatococcus lobatus TaxID=904363 RepID=A0AAW1QXN7_9CHLO
MLFTSLHPCHRGIGDTGVPGRPTCVTGTPPRRALETLQDVRQAKQDEPCHSTASLVITQPPLVLCESHVFLNSGQVLKEDSQLELLQKLEMDIDM